MQLKSLITSVLFLNFLTVCHVAMQDITPTPKKTLIELWHVGDDGSSLRFFDEVEKTFGKSKNFVFSYGNKEGTLIVTIPSNIKWVKIENRTQVMFIVEFTNSNKNLLKRIDGKCWETQMSVCVTKILNETELVARKL
jgi:hypothetical protein